MCARKCDGGGRRRSATFSLFFFALALSAELRHLEIAAKSFSQHTCIRSKAQAAEIQRPLVGRNIKIMCKVEFLWPPFPGFYDLQNPAARTAAGFPFGLCARRVCYCVRPTVHAFCTFNYICPPPAESPFCSAHKKCKVGEANFLWIVLGREKGSRWKFKFAFLQPYFPP